MKTILITLDNSNFGKLELIKEFKNNEIWYTVPHSISSPNIELVIEDLKKQVSNYKVNDKDEIELKQYFNKFISKIIKLKL